MPRAYLERPGSHRNSQVGANGGMPRPTVRFTFAAGPYPRFSTKMGMSLLGGAGHHSRPPESFGAIPGVLDMPEACFKCSFSRI